MEGRGASFLLTSVYHHCQRHIESFADVNERQHESKIPKDFHIFLRTSVCLMMIHFVTTYEGQTKSQMLKKSREIR